MSRRAVSLLGLAALALTSCDAGRPSPAVALASAGAATPATAVADDAMWVRYPPRPVAPSRAAELGRQLFFDESISASGAMACSTCHDPEHAYAPANDRAVQLGGRRLDRAGLRAVPSLRYLRYTPKFSRHLARPAPDGVDDEGPAGGFARDGAAQTLQEQVLRPLLNPVEMANPSQARLAVKLREASYAGDFRALYGQAALDQPSRAVALAGEALEAFLTEDPSFEPYTSKFDSVMTGHATFSAPEKRGYRLFNDPQKGNCAKCHVDTPGPGGRPAQFTDYGMVALGVPRNPGIPANRRRDHFDLGLCGPTRQDLRAEDALCGMFKTPTLRNVATRQVFFHNGRFRRLEDALRFYSERDTRPEKWYPVVRGRAGADDLPPRHRANIDRAEEPFTRKLGAEPVFNDRDIADLTAFLKTLDDGYAATSGGRAPR